MKKQPKGQTLVIFAIAALALVFFIGLAVDSGSLYVTYGQLKRSVDAAAVSAANEFKRQEPGHELEVIPKMTYAATEIFKLQDLDPNSVDLEIRLCDSDFDGFRDADLVTISPDFFNRCPITNIPDPVTGLLRQPRKLIWVRATQEAPLYFLHLLGFDNIPLTTDAIAEAASVDMVLVFDTSESMASDTLADLCEPFVTAGENCPFVDNYDAGCNATNTCQPLLQAKDAANALIGNLYDGYDRVGIVTFDTQAQIRLNLGENDALDPQTHLEEASDAIDAIPLHNDAPYALMWPQWKMFPGMFNPVFPEDRDGDGNDEDDDLPTCQDNVSHPLCCDVNDPSGHNPGEWDRWDESHDYWGWGGVPCDAWNKNDAFDMNADGIYTEADNVVPGDSASVLSTCHGCGIRVASNVLREFGRSGSVWVVVFLSDGAVNLSDTPNTDPLNPDLADYPNGFCTGGMGTGWWTSQCFDTQFAPRHCIDTAAGTCPPGSVWDGTTPNLNYSVLDYALDMTDTAALTRSLNLNEPGGNEISIYTIGLGAAGGDTSDPFTVSIGEQLLRYMAAVGDDGDRETDPCDGVGPRRICGQYYFAPSGAALEGIFLDIASRIYTRISQ